MWNKIFDSWMIWNIMASSVKLVSLQKKLYSIIKEYNSLGTRKELEYVEWSNRNM